MLDLLDLVVMIPATWRLTSLLVQEDGPFHVLKWIRDHVPHGGVLDCIWCCSVWVAIGIFAVYQLVQWPVWVLALSAGAILYDKYAAS